MSPKNRNNLLQAVSGNESLGIFSPNGFSINSTYASIDIAFKVGVISNIENISFSDNQHNIKTYRVTFFDINDRAIDERLLNRDKNELLFIDNVATIRIVFLETIDNKNIKNVKLSIRGCFFQIPKYKSTKAITTTTTKAPKKSDYCQPIELMDRQHAKRLLSRVGGTLNISQIYKTMPSNKSQSSFFILEFNKDIFIRNIHNISILTKNHHVQQIRVELQNKKRQLLKTIDISLFEQSPSDTNLYTPFYPIHVKYLTVTILKGRTNENITWSIIGCFDRIKKVRKTITKILKTTWWTGKIFY